MTCAFDTNILIYSVEAGPKGDQARSLLADGGLLTVQNINEFTNVAIRKLGFTWDDVAQAMAVFIELCGEPRPIDYAAHLVGRALAERYRLSFYDALIAATALNAGVATLFSEDMQDGLIIDRRLKISNPFC